ncbi:MAG: calcium/sodium antiporter [Duncaniella sp.]|nr:calcium/sodium antiporter [Duncaniella sp.]MDE7145289.1 calcium/sodium antiporter [Duncaniella sp.]
MLLDVLILIGGCVLILCGANFLTDGASAMAKRWGVSDLVIGLTVVAFGTSAPELVISVTSAIKGSAGLAIGNIVGSNIFNILVIVGSVAIVSPIKVKKSYMTNEIPLVILSALVLLICANGVWLNGDASNEIDRVDGLLMLLFFAIFMRYTLSIAREKQVSAPTPVEANEAVGMAETDEVKDMAFWKAVIYVAGGLAALIFGGDLFVKGASGVARGLNVSESVIGLTIVAAGTSLPDLAASLAAALKNKPGLAVGNIVGSNIFNIFFVLGVSSTVAPLPLGGITNVDFMVLLGACILFWVFGWLFKRRTITRAEGVVLVSCFIAYTAYLVANA